MKTLPAITSALALLCIWLTGCTPASTREALARADSIMATAPDSALAILDALDPATLNSDETKAMYAVSLTEARHMAYVPVYDASLITVGADYYLTHGSPEEKARAFYYSAIVRYNNSNYEQAIVDGLRAEKHALTTSDHLRLGLIYRTIADCFRALYDASSAIHYYTVSYEHFRLAPTQKYTGWGLVDLSRANIVKGDNETALKFAYQALGYADSVGNDDLKVNALRNIAGANFYSNEYDETIKYLETLRSLRSQALLDDDYELLGESYLVMGNPVKAQECQDSLNARQSDTYGLQVMLYERAKEFESANRLQGKMLEYQNNEVKKLFTRNYARTISEYYGLEEKAAIEQISKSKMTLVSVIIVTIILLAFAYIFFRYRTNLLSSQIEARISEAQNLEKILFEKSSQLDDMKTDRDKLVNKLSQRDSELERIREESHRGSTASVPAIARDEIRHLLAGRFEHLDRLCSVYFQFKGQSNEKDKISSDVLEIINGIQYDDKIKAKLEETINGNLGDVMVRFRKDFPSVKERDYMLFMLLILDFSPRAISILQDLKTEVVYNHKSKLKRKIAASNSEYKDEYLSYIG